MTEQPGSQSPRTPVTPRRRTGPEVGRGPPAPQIGAASGPADDRDHAAAGRAAAAPSPPPSGSASTSKTKPTHLPRVRHLIVFQHGIQGAASDFDNLVLAIQKEYRSALDAKDLPIVNVNPGQNETIAQKIKASPRMLLGAVIGRSPFRESPQSSPRASEEDPRKASQGDEQRGSNAERKLDIQDRVLKSKASEGGRWSEDVAAVGTTASGSQNKFSPRPRSTNEDGTSTTIGAGKNATDLSGSTTRRANRSAIGYSPRAVSPRVNVKTEEEIEEIEIHTAKHSDCFFGTTDGLAAGGKRLFEEIWAKLTETDIAHSEQYYHDAAVEAVANSLSGRDFNFSGRKTKEQGGSRAGAAPGSIAPRPTTPRNKTNGTSPSTLAPVRYLSVVGHSLGGLYLRYALALLQDRLEQQPRKLQFCTFLTLATPHLGIRRPQHQNFWNDLVQTLASWGNKTQQELCLEEPELTALIPPDHFTRPVRRRDSERPSPLLVQMATEERFLAPLRQFRRRLLYANVFYDVLCPYCTGSIRPVNPYRHEFDMQRLGIQMVAHPPPAKSKSVDIDDHVEQVEQSGQKRGGTTTSTTFKKSLGGAPPPAPVVQSSLLGSQGLHPDCKYVYNLYGAGAKSETSSTPTSGEQARTAASKLQMTAGSSSTVNNYISARKQEELHSRIVDERVVDIVAAKLAAYDELVRNRKTKTSASKKSTASASSPPCSPRQGTRPPSSAAQPQPPAGAPLEPPNGAAPGAARSGRSTAQQSSINADGEQAGEDIERQASGDPDELGACVGPVVPAAEGTNTTTSTPNTPGRRAVSAGFALRDKRSQELQKMMHCLNTMSWERVDVNMNSARAHC
ncbi:unnamed protein product [Amoebophrya sp. A120]|nr:unnamed protein product [Amoebophrya sp. A120]|eukprot:GSA120T00020050001.1